MNETWPGNEVIGLKRILQKPYKKLCVYMSV